MKNILVFIFFFWQINSLVGQSTVVDTSITWALIIGISDYQDNAISDLFFAHRDADAFAKFLHSPAGGNLSESNIQLLQNEKATAGNIFVGLSWLIEESKPGDRCIIYFSGHGDVELVTKSQWGFLLAYDSPPKLYGAGGTISIHYLQDIISTLSTNGVQVMMISDACHAGKLAGASRGGPMNTANSLMKKFANEIKIMSCQPNEFSVEGEQWGGGRGCFSYHLINALIGDADSNNDGLVNLMETSRYLEDNVSREVLPIQQIPIVTGNLREVLAKVHPPTLAEWLKNKKIQPPQLHVIDQRNLEDIALEKVDSNIAQLYYAFKKALKEKNFLVPLDSSLQSHAAYADAYYQKLIELDELKSIRSSLTRNFAAALIDEGQQFINLLLNTDPKIVDELATGGSIDFYENYRRTKRAAELLGEYHFIFNSLKAKENYFLAKSLKSKNTPPEVKKHNYRQLIETGLSFQKDAPYLLIELLPYFTKDSLDIMAVKLDSIAPDWALGLNRIAGAYWLFDLWTGIQYFKKAILADSTYLPSYSGLATYHTIRREFSEAKKYSSKYAEIMQQKLKGSPNNIFVYELGSYSMALLALRQYKDAIQIMNQAEALARERGRKYQLSGSLAMAYSDLGMYEEALKQEERSGQSDLSLSTRAALCHLFMNNHQKAEEYFRQTSLFPQPIPTNMLIYLFATDQNERLATLLDSLHFRFTEEPNYFFYQAESHRRIGNSTKTIETFRKLAELCRHQHTQAPYFYPYFVFQIIALHRLGLQEELNTTINSTSEKYSKLGEFHFQMACFYAMTGDPEKALTSLQKAENTGWEPNEVLWVEGTVKDPLLDPLRHLPEFQAWEKHWSPPYKDNSKN